MRQAIIFMTVIVLSSCSRNEVQPKKELLAKKTEMAKKPTKVSEPELKNIFAYTGKKTELNVQIIKSELFFIDDNVKSKKESNLDAQYCRIKISRIGSKSAGIQKINKTLDSINYKWLTYLNPNFTSVNENEYIKFCKRKLSTEEGLHDAEYLFDCDVIGIFDNIVSVRISDRIFVGAPHGVEHQEGFLFDINTGERVFLEDLFTTNKKEFLTSIFKYLLLEYKDYDDYNPADYIDFKRFIGDSASLDEKVDLLIRELGDKPAYYLDETGLKIFFNVYHLSSYASGMLEFNLYPEVLKPLGFKNITFPEGEIVRWPTYEPTNAIAW